MSPCGQYRFKLWRMVPPGLLTGHPRWNYCLFVMNNPSIADAEHDDPTIRRVMGFASLWGFSRLDVANVNPCRSTDPKAATRPPEDVLLDNDAWLGNLARQADLVVAAWGSAADPELADRAMNILRAEHPIFALGLTRDGHPRHPLYLPKDTELTIWKGQKCN